MKILLFITNIGNTGVDRYLSALESFLVLSHDTRIVYFGENKNLYDFASPVEKLDVKTGDGFLAETNRRMKIRNYIKAQNPDLIISFGESANVDLAFATVSMDRKLIITEHSKHDDEKSGSFKNTAYKKADFLAVLNKKQYDDFSFMKGRMQIIYPPFKLPMADFGKKEKIILSVGRLEKVKGYENYIKALSMISGSIRDGWEMVLCGTGSMEPRIRDLASSLGVSVSFLGHRRDISNYYAKASIVALPSLKETLPNALIESIFFNCARFSTPTDGAKELIENGKDGIMSDDFSPKAMKEALEKLMSSQELRLKCALEAGKRQSAFIPENFHQTWNKIINQIAK